MKNKSALVVAAVKQYAQAVAYIGKSYKFSGRIVGMRAAARYAEISVRLNDHTAATKAQSDRVLETLKSAAASTAVAQLVEGLIVYQIELPERLATFYNSKHVPSHNKPVVGLAIGHEPILLDVVDDEPHALIVGATGSGKTETIKRAVFSMAQTMTPHQIEMFIVDVKRSKFDGFNHMAHLGAPIARDDSEIDRTIAHVYDIMQQRKQTGLTMQRNARLKRILLVLDELTDTSIIGERRSQNAQHVAMISQIAKLGREHGVHLLCGIQTARREDVPFLDNLANRFVGRVVDSSASYTASGLAGLRAHMLAGKGDFYQIKTGAPTRFQVATISTRDFDRLPRAEIAALPAVEKEIVDLPADNKRPRKEIDADTLAYYLVDAIANKGVSKITIKQAHEALQLSRHMHDRYKSFSAQLLTKSRQIIAARAELPVKFAEQGEVPNLE